MKKILYLFLYIPFVLQSQYRLDDISFWINHDPYRENIGNRKHLRSVETKLYSYTSKSDSSCVEYVKQEYNANEQLVKLYGSYIPSKLNLANFIQVIYEKNKLKRVEMFNDGKINGSRSFIFEGNRLTSAIDSTHKDNILKTVFNYDRDTVFLHIYSSKEPAKRFHKLAYILDSSLRVIEKINYYSLDTNYITEHEYYNFKNANEYDYYKYNGAERVLAECALVTFNKQNRTLRLGSCKPGEKEIKYVYTMNAKKDWVTQTFLISDKTYRAFRIITYY